MIRRLCPVLVLFATLTATPVAWAVSLCTAGNPSANIPQSTPTSAFTDNGDGTVTHTLTGLMWKRCSEGQTWNSGTSTCDGTAAPESWSQALFAGVSDLTGGHTDWRLPNRKELESTLEACG